VVASSRGVVVFVGLMCPLIADLKIDALQWSHYNGRKRWARV